PRPYQWRSAAGAFAAMCVLLAIALAPWAQRNGQIVGSWVWTTTNSGITAYDGFNPAADGSSNQNFVSSMPELAAMSEVRRSEYLSGKAREYVMQHPLRSAWLSIRKIGRTWSPMPLSREYGGRMPYVAAGLLYSVPLDVLVLGGVFRRGDFGRPVKPGLVSAAVGVSACQ